MFHVVHIDTSGINLSFRPLSAHALFVDRIAEVYANATIEAAPANRATLRHLRASARNEFVSFLEQLLEIIIGMKTTCLYLRCLAWHMYALETQ